MTDMQTFEIYSCDHEDYLGDKTDPMKISSMEIDAIDEDEAVMLFESEYGHKETIVRVTT